MEKKRPKYSKGDEIYLFLPRANNPKYGFGKIKDVSVSMFGIIYEVEITRPHKTKRLYKSITENRVFKTKEEMLEAIENHYDEQIAEHKIELVDEIKQRQEFLEKLEKDGKQVYTQYNIYKDFLKDEFEKE